MMMYKSIYIYNLLIYIHNLGEHSLIVWVVYARSSSFRENKVKH
jgi:hypothetical protein